MTAALRVLQLCSARQYIGEAARVVELSEGLAGAGHAVRLLARRGHSVEAEAGRRGLPCRGLHMESRFLPWRDLPDILAIREEVARFAPDIIHVHRGKDHWLAAAALPRGQAKLVRTRHVVTPIRVHAANRWLYRRRCDGLICTSRAVREIVDTVAPLFDCPVATIPGGVNLERLSDAAPEEVRALRARLQIPAGAPVITCLARLAPVKGQEYLVRAIPQVRARCPEAVFVFAFPRASEYRHRLAALVDDLAVLPAVRWLENPAALSPFFGLSDVGVLSSVGSEGWSRAVAEYLAMGVAVVATRVGCVPELVEPDRTGQLVPPRDSTALGEAILRLLADPQARQAQGEVGRRLVRESLTREHLIARVLQFYDELRQGRAACGR